MQARSGAFQLDPDKLDAAISSFEENHLPRYREYAGYKGFRLLANRSNGKVIGLSFWESEDDLRASDDLGSSAREDLQQEGGGQGAIDREDWDVVIDDPA